MPIPPVLHAGLADLPIAGFAAMAALALGAFAGIRASRGMGVDIAPTLWRAALVGAVAARLAFVWQWRVPYFDHPLAILDLRDGGWSLETGFIAAALYGFYRIRRTSVLRRPLAASLIVAGTVLAIGSIAELGVRPDAKLPPLELQSLQGDPVTLAAFAGRPIVLNLWASWCGPCRREMPLLQEAQRSAPGVHFVFLNQGEPPAVVADYLSRHGIELRNVLLDRRLQAGSSFGQRALPTTLFFDPTGALVGTRVGELTADTLAERLAPWQQRTPPVPQVPTR